MKSHAALRDVPEDQLCLASVHYMRAHYQEAIDVYKKLLLERRYKKNVLKNIKLTITRIVHEFNRIIYLY